MKRFLIIVNGLPATGKTTLANKLAFSLNLPIFGKDEIKEQIADELSGYTKEDAMRLGLISRLTLNLIVAQLKDKLTYIIDANFSPGPQTEKFIKIVKDLNVIEIYLKADGQTLYNRFAARATNRHPIQLEHHLDLKDFESTLTQGLLEPLNLGILIEVDTTDFTSVDYDKIIDEVKTLSKHP